jgi:1,2-dihydroxy-3-keto-5-methylthiopentene dioxygenase
MARLEVPATGQAFTDAAEICRFLEPFGIWYERWDTGPARVEPDASAEEILKAYSPEIEALKKKGGYVTADLINVNPETPGLEDMLAKFRKEHTHSEDEVRFCVKGKGMFHINPETAPVFSIEMEAGDLINVPAGTRHWFNLCQDKSIRVIRMFLDMTGWTPHYLEDRDDEKYKALCFSQARPESAARQESVVKP